MRVAYYYLALIALWSAVVATTAVRCPVSTCSPSDPSLPTVWLNISSSASQLRGASFRVYSNDNHGHIYEKSYVELKLTNIREQQASDGSSVCDRNDLVPEIISGDYRVLHDLDWSLMCCETSTSWEIIDGVANRSSVTLTMTDPDHPDFKAQFHLSVANQSVSRHVEGTPNTLNMDYDVTYSYVFWTSHPLDTYLISF